MNKLLLRAKKTGTQKIHTVWVHECRIKKWTELTYGLEVKRVITFRVESDWEGKNEFLRPC